MDGVLNIYKEQDFTSFDVVAKLRGILHQRKIGHTGTLDPMAEGVLPVCVGSGTKLCEMLTDHDKIYEAEMILGVTYDTEDVTGQKLTEQKVMSTETEIVNAVKSFVGGYDQIPPMYSAKKVDGKKLYEIARSGKTIERKSVHVDIYDIEILAINIPNVSIRVSCGKGTYIRTLISDIGAKLQCGAAMKSLKRTCVGDFNIEKALKLSEVERLVGTGEIDKYLIPVDKVFSELKRATIPEKLCKLIENGNKLIEEDFPYIEGVHVSELENGERVTVYDYKGCFRAVYEMNSDKVELKPYKMFL